MTDRPDEIQDVGSPADFLDYDSYAFAHVLSTMVREDILDFEALEQEDGLTTDMVLVLVSKLTDSRFEQVMFDSLTDEEESEDAKLSTKKRKSLPKGSFCGPGRSFPTPDCAHVRAAARLVNRFKGSPATKAKIRACINRKNKSLSCGVKMGK